MRKALVVRPVVAAAAVLSVAAGPVPLRSAGPVVTSVSPAPHGAAVDRTAVIEITLDAPIDPATVDEAVSVFGRWSGVLPGTVRMDSDHRTVRFIPSRPFAAGESVHVSVSRSLRGADGVALARGYAWSFWARSARGTLDLRTVGERTTRREGEGRVQSYGAYAGDLDGDGFSDLAVPNEQANDVRLFFNDGRGGYRDFTVLDIPDGAVPSPNEGADFNHDGFVDFAVGNAGNSFVSVFVGDGRGGFRHEGNHTADRAVRGVCLLDLDGDGSTDIATANMRGGGRAGNVSLLRNDGTGDFTHAGNLATNARAGKTCASADANGDGVVDLFVGAYGSREVVVFLGDGEGRLVYHSKVDAGGSPWMIVAGDVNGDGHVDVLSANRREHNVSVLWGDGRGGLGEAQTYRVGREPLAVDIGDVDGDGDLDVITSNIVGKDFTLFENDGAGRLENPRTLNATGGGSCAIIHDRDNDGDLDITGVDEIDDKIYLWENG